MEPLFCNDRFDQYRLIADPLIDPMIKKISLSLENGHCLSMKTLDRLVLEPERYLPSNKAREFEHLINQISQVPECLDPKYFEIGARVFQANAPSIYLILLCASLPQAYACSKGVEVLSRSSNLSNDQSGYQKVFERLSNTCNFVHHCMQPMAFLDKHSIGNKAVISVRLRHSLIRHYLLGRGWNSNEFGKPINQEDMAGTLVAFSIVILEGMKKIGISLSTQEKEAFIHVWQVVGLSLGINSELVPADYHQASRLRDTIFSRNLKYSKEGSLLMSDLMQFIDLKLFRNRNMGFGKYLIYRLAAPEVLECFDINVKNGLQKTILFDPLFSSYKRFNKTGMNNSQLAVQLKNRFTNKVLDIDTSPLTSRFSKHAHRADN